MKKRKPELVGQKARQMSIFSPAGSLDHANLSLQQEKEQEQKMIATSGLRCYELYQNYIPDGLLRKMSQVLLASTKAWYSKQCSLIWKVKGIKSNRFCFQLVPSTPRIEGIEYGLLPTAQTQGLKVCDENGKTQFFKMPMLPTQDCSDRRSMKSKQQGLSNVVKMLPTPRAGKISNESEESWQKRKDAGNVSTPPLALAINMLPTLATRDYKGANGKDHMTKDRPHMDQLPNAITHGTNTGTMLRLEPAFVEFMQGYPEGWTELTD